MIGIMIYRDHRGPISPKMPRGKDIEHTFWLFVIDALDSEPDPVPFPKQIGRGGDIDVEFVNLPRRQRHSSGMRMKGFPGF
jgi:hypothetical protein